MHAEDVLVLDREIDVGQRDLARIAVQFEAAGAARHRADKIGLLQFRHQTADDDRIGMYAFRHEGRAHGSLAREPGEDTHGVDRDDKSAAGQHNGNSASYIGMTAGKGQANIIRMVTDC